MIVNPELVKKIKDYFNLNIYETKVWLALLSKGIASAGEIAELSGVPRSRTYDVLESLEKRGFCIAKIGKPTKYIVINPKQVIEKLKKKTIYNAEEKVKILDKLKGTREYEELEELHKASFNPIKKEEITGALKGKLDIYSHLRSILENAEKEVLVCIPAFELLEKKRMFKNIFSKLLEKNLKIKLAVNGTDADIKKISRQYNIKLQKSKIKSKFFIIDREQVLFNLNNSKIDEEELAVWLNTEFFSEALANMFEASLNNHKRK